MLAAAGAVVNAATLGVRGYIDVKFTGSGAVAGVNGDEISAHRRPATLGNVLDAG